MPWQTRAEGPISRSESSCKLGLRVSPSTQIFRQASNSCNHSVHHRSQQQIQKKQREKPTHHTAKPQPPSNLSPNPSCTTTSHGERKRRNRRPVSPPSIFIPIPPKQHNPTPKNPITHLHKPHLLPDTSPANAPPQTASSKPKTTPQCRSPSARWTRTAGIRARTRCMRSVALSGRGRRGMIV
jgi:hypothetical protein